MTVSDGKTIYTVDKENNVQECIGVCDAYDPQQRATIEVIKMSLSNITINITMEKMQNKKVKLNASPIAYPDIHDYCVQLTAEYYDNQTLSSLIMMKNKMYNYLVNNYKDWNIKDNIENDSVLSFLL